MAGPSKTQNESSMHTRNINTFTRCSLLAGAILGLTLPFAHGANINWGAAQNIAGDSDVSIGGTLVGAFNIGDGGVTATTVNGVAFQPFALDSTSGPVDSGAKGDFLLTTADLFVSDNSLFGSPAAPFSGLSADYKTLLQSGTLVTNFAINPGAFSLTMSNLNLGTTYQFQWWANLSDVGALNHVALAGNSVTLSDNTTNLDGGLGQHAVGTFTADATSQVITFEGVGSPNNYALINAFQLRQVPEPSSVALLGLAVLALGFRTRCRRRG